MPHGRRVQNVTHSDKHGSITPPQAPPVELVQSLFDLSPAEARVARRLAAGETVEKIASIA
jgi:DNA-binding CsgD family transcriptional regulator